MPEAHEVLPALHAGPMGVQSWFSVQARHVPLEQTLFVPQVVPSSSGLPVSVQAGVPPEQSSAPAWHVLAAGTHAAPDMQVWHCPAEHTIPVPQAFPFDAFPVSMQTALPVLQAIWPTRQGDPAMSQAIPSVHALQVPCAQTMFVPHEVPSVTAVPESVHTALPPVQERVPVWQAFAGTHEPPSLQATQEPPPHTFPCPQGVPSGASPASMQTAIPVAQLVCPSLQACWRSQDTPSAHARHWPPEHTMPVPHDAPSDWKAIVS